MNDDQGWISIHRKIMQDVLYPKNRPFTQFEAWIDLLLTANHSERQVILQNELFTCKRGESLRSLKTLSEKWNWSVSKVRRYLKLLEKRHGIVLKSEQKSTRITICNYDRYQGERNANETQTKRRRYTNNKDKNDNKNTAEPKIETNLITNDTI